MKNNISSLSRVLLIIAALALIVSLFVPLWSIYLDAPQYPEGLRLQIWANAIAGDVDIINGLNHYIGMKTLHTKDFIEFTLLPYLIVFFAVVFVLAAVIARKKILYTAFGAFVIFGIISMADFWKWEYDYGHNLDPNAAIKVPGMAYQPPLIGFKQLLNFGAYSIPDIGGWMFVSAGALLLIAVLMESNMLKRKQPHGISVFLLFSISLFITSCGEKEAEPILLNKDACDHCKMAISDGRFVAEIVTKKGRVYKFDDINCMNAYIATQDKATIARYYIGDFTKENELTDATAAWYVRHETLRSPMGGNTAAFASEETAQKKASELNVDVNNWEAMSNTTHFPDQGGEEHER